MNELKEKEKGLIENTIKSLLEEWEMYYNSISPTNLEYIENISKSICKFSKKLETLENGYKTNEKYSDNFDMVKDSNVDNAMYDAITEYSSYIDYKKKYMETKNSEYVTMSDEEFGHMIDNLKIALEEIDSITKEDDSKQSNKEREMLKTFAKWAYQVFS